MSKREETRKELEEIRRRMGGTLRPADVVDFAKNPKTALHSLFDWDDSEAAQKWRLEQARVIIRMTVTVLTGTEQKFRAYVSLPEDRKNGNGYRTTEEVLSTGHWRESLLANALQELRTFRNKYRQLSQLAPIFSAIDRVERKHGTEEKARAAC